MSEWKNICLINLSTVKLKYTILSVTFNDCTIVESINENRKPNKKKLQNKKPWLNLVLLSMTITKKLNNRKKPKIL